MSRILPHPVTSVLVAGLWLIISASPGAWPAPGSVVMALLLGWLLPLATTAFWPAPPRLRRPGTALRLIAVVLADIITANITVAIQVLGPTARLRPRQFPVEIELDDPFVATLLGGIISLTPGTVTIDIEMIEGRPRRLQVHGLDVPDAAAAAAFIKARYEAPLKEIFGC